MRLYFSLVTSRAFSPFAALHGLGCRALRPPSRWPLSCVGGLNFIPCCHGGRHLASMWQLLLISGPDWTSWAGAGPVQFVSVSGVYLCYCKKQSGRAQYCEAASRSIRFSRVWGEIFLPPGAARPSTSEPRCSLCRRQEQLKYEFVCPFGFGHELTRRRSRGPVWGKHLQFSQPPCSHCAALYSPQVLPI